MLRTVLLVLSIAALAGASLSIIAEGYRLRVVAAGLALFVLTFTVGCASHVPPNLSPAGVAAYNGTQVVKALDVLRDAAVAANELQPPLVDISATRKVVEYHRAALRTIEQAPNGWQSTVAEGLKQTIASLPKDAQQLLAPYTALVSDLIGRLR